MRLRSQLSLTGPSGTPWSVWITSALFSFVVLAGYRVLEQREFLTVVATLTLIHVVIVIARSPQLSWHLFLSQTFVVAASLVSVVLHSRHAVGSTPPGWSTTFRSFLQAALTSPSTYLYFAGYVVAFCVALFLVLLATRASRLQTTVDAEVALVAAYAMSSVNVAFDYSLTRPLYHVSGEPDALAFFFTAGLFGVDFSLPLHLVVLALCIWWRYLGQRPAQAALRDRRSTASSAATR